MLSSLEREALTRSSSSIERELMALCLKHRIDWNTQWPLFCRFYHFPDGSGVYHTIDADARLVHVFEDLDEDQKWVLKTLLLEKCVSCEQSLSGQGLARILAKKDRWVKGVTGPLVRRGLVDARKGPGGGYWLTGAGYSCALAVTLS